MLCRLPVDLHRELVLVGPGQAGAGGNLRLPVGLLVGHELGQDGLWPGLRIGDGGHRLIAQPQPLPPPGAVGVDGGGRSHQPLDEVGPVVDQNSAALGHPQGKIVQGIQQTRVLPAVL